uniref:Calpain catalytic domain-containing protein n=1 Tax=Strigamia maritima TaxID=126957 RepID=T1JCQ1_STRMM
MSSNVTWSFATSTQRRNLYRKTDSLKFGEKGSGFRCRTEIQDFEKIRDQCFAEGRLFEDRTFDADDANIFYSKQLPRPFQWKRPGEIVDDPHFFVEGVSRFDVRQGELGDCWLLAAVANLTLNTELFHRVVPPDQGFMRSKKYAGIFHFRFWQFGKWIDVVVDDRLPTFYGKLVFLQSKDNNEFWSALLEKAYAKLHGSYEALKGGRMCEAMCDFTGGLTEEYKLSQAPPNLFTIMSKAYDRSSLMGCAIPPEPGEAIEGRMSNGLIKGHAYSITCVKMVDIKTPRVSGKIPLVRIRNPWGNEAEWSGPWSDKSREWNYISADEKEQLGITFEADGEFWMSYADFIKNFVELEICNLSPDSLDEPKKCWATHTFDGSWVKGITAGGCRNHIDTFGCNPQYRITLDDPDEEDDEQACTTIISLMQKNRRAQRKMGIDALTIGFVLYLLKNPNSAPRPLPRKFFEYTATAAKVDSFTNLREVCQRYKLAPGTYCIVPSTFEPHQQGNFILRVYSEKKNDMQEHDDEVGVNEADENVVEEVKKAGGGSTDAISECFKKIAGDDMEVDANELKEVLDFVLKKEFDFPGFGINLCRGIVAMMDQDHSGKLALEEFKTLWFNIATWKRVFKMYDENNTGSLTTFQLRSALASSGYHLNLHILKRLTLRYANKNNTMTFEDFIMCAVKLKTMIEVFKEKDPKGTNHATFQLDEWLKFTMYA